MCTLYTKCTNISHANKIFWMVVEASKARVCASTNLSSRIGYLLLCSVVLWISSCSESKSKMGPVELTYRPQYLYLAPLVSKQDLVELPWRWWQQTSKMSPAYLRASVFLSCSSRLKTGSSRASLQVVVANFENQPLPAGLCISVLLVLSQNRIQWSFPAGGGSKLKPKMGPVELTCGPQYFYFARLIWKQDPI